MRKIQLAAALFIKLLLAFVTILLLFIPVAYLIDQIWDGKSVVYPLIGLWLFLAYVVLPRVHRNLSKLYIPDYFIGRTKSPDGFFSDPVNIAVIGSEKKLHEIMLQAGWVKAHKTTWKTGLRITQAAIRRRSYKHAPVSPLYLFGTEQDFAYEQEVKNNPRSRHHVRFWKVPKNWYLPGGYKADWLGAATFDRNVGISLYTGQITHKISEHTDEERDHLVETLKKSKLVKDITIVKHFTTAFKHRTGGGDKITTDGSLAFVNLK